MYTKAWLQPSISACNIDVDPEGKSFYAKEIVLDEPYILICSDYSSEDETIFNPQEIELTPYECTRFSGVLDFWDDESEDIYNFEDGQPL
jgi:hypothetical protein